MAGEFSVSPQVAEAIAYLEQNVPGFADLPYEVKVQQAQAALENQTPSQGPGQAQAPKTPTAGIDPVVSGLIADKLTGGSLSSMVGDLFAGPSLTTGGGSGGVPGGIGSSWAGTPIAGGGGIGGVGPVGYGGQALGAYGMYNMAKGSVPTRNPGSVASKTAQGAAAGWALGGPWGAGIGAGLGLIRGMWKSGKHRDQKYRDAQRNDLQQRGIAQQINGSHHLMLYDGTTYEIGKDGNNKYQSFDGQGQYRPYNTDATNPMGAQADKWGNALSYVLWGNPSGDDRPARFGGYFANAALSNASDMEQVRANFLTWAQQTGLDEQTALAMLAEAYQNGEIDQGALNVYSDAIRTMFNGEYDQNGRPLTYEQGSINDRRAAEGDPLLLPASPGGEQIEASEQGFQEAAEDQPIEPVPVPRTPEEIAAMQGTPANPILPPRTAEEILGIGLPATAGEEILLAPTPMQNFQTVMGAAQGASNSQDPQSIVERVQKRAGQPSQTRELANRMVSDVQQGYQAVANPQTPQLQTIEGIIKQLYGNPLGA